MGDAIKQASHLDDYLAENGRTMGPVHVLPVSIKDHIPIAGTFSSQGCFHSILKDDEDCDMTSILRQQGAVFYCKTNQPQSLMHLESDSHWGRVLKPFNIHLCWRLNRRRSSLDSNERISSWCRYRYWRVYPRSISFQWDLWLQGNFMHITTKRVPQDTVCS